MVRRMAQSLVDTKPADVIFDLMIHDLDLLQLYGGNVIDLAVTECKRGPAGFVRVGVKLRTESGIVADLLASQVHAGAERSWAFPEHGLRFDLHRGEAFADDLPLPRRGEQDALSLQWQAFRAALSGHTTKVASAREAHSAVVLAHVLPTGSRDEYAHAS